MAGYYLLVGRRFDENDDDAAADILEACDDDLVRKPPPRTINQQPGLLDVLLPPANIPDDVGNIASRIDRVNHPPDDPRIGGCWLTFVVWHEHARFCASHRPGRPTQKSIGRCRSLESGRSAWDRGIQGFGGPWRWQPLDRLFIRLIVVILFIHKE